MKHHQIAENMAKLARAEIAMKAQQAREKINRSFGQHLRNTQARIELARRAYKCRP